MNFRKIFKITGTLLFIEGLAMLLPIIAALFFKEYGIIWAYLVPAIIIGASGYALTKIKQKEDSFYAKDGFLVVGMSWVLLPLLGCIPVLLSGDIKGFVNAFFEIVSGFTTTGASVVADVEILSKATLLWRSVVSFLGGMGIVVFMLAILPENGGSMHIYRAETTGTNATKLVSKMRFTARILYLIYTGFTIILTALLCVEMPFFDAVCHAMSTASTCGFSTKNASIGAFGNYTQIVITIFMFLYSINFTLFYLILIGRGKDVLKNEELRTYLLLLFTAIILITISISNKFGGFINALKYSSFTAISLVSTTGFNNVNFYTLGSMESWPTIAIMLLLGLMCMGGMAGSTSGGMKVARLGILSKSVLNDLRKSAKPNKVIPIRFEGKILDSKEVSGVKLFFVLYVFIVIASTVILSAFGGMIETNLTASISAISNVGPAFGEIGYTGFFGNFNPICKIVLCVVMLLGRLEILPLLVLFVPSTWKFK